MMTDKAALTKKAIFILFAAFFALGGLLFLSAGTFSYWQAWSYLAVLFIPAAIFVTYLLIKEPGTLERRMHTKEREPGQQVLSRLGYLAFLLMYILPGLDVRFGWSNVPAAIVIASDSIVLIGYVLFTVVLLYNRYASRVIEVEKGQELIATGPYSIIRHPMYFSVLSIWLFSPLALGSYWAMIPALFIVVIVVMRIFTEERVLTEELEGYAGYKQKVPFRLIPRVW